MAFAAGAYVGSSQTGRKRLTMHLRFLNGLNQNVIKFMHYIKHHISKKKYGSECNVRLSNNTLLILKKMYVNIHQTRAILYQFYFFV